VIAKRGVAILAREVRSAALHLDGNDIERGMVMGAAGLRIKPNTADFQLCNFAFVPVALAQGLCELY
jgi:hypothetical protein